MGDDILKPKNNSKANSNADNEFINQKEAVEKKQNFQAPVNPSTVPWDRTPNTAIEMINAYGTYEIQPTADSSEMFPAISQGLPSDDITHNPKSFHEGIVPKLND